MLEDLEQAIVDLDYLNIRVKVTAAIDAGTPPLAILDRLKNGLDEVGARYHRKEYFLSELFMAGETMEAALAVLMPLLSKEHQHGEEGVVLIGSIHGDVHDFGKNIAKTLLAASGFTVHDLGVDVPPDRFVAEAERLHADVIGISAILTATQPGSQAVVDALTRKGIRDQFKVILGGTGVTDRAVQDYGVDAAVNDATEGVAIIRRWVETKGGAE
jgi:methanogenic corrinoid protein MtbC1